MSQKRNTRARASGMTQISLSLPEGLIPVIDQMAASENRNRSNFIANSLRDLAAKRGITSAAKPLGKAA